MCSPISRSLPFPFLSPISPLPSSAADVTAFAFCLRMILCGQRALVSAERQYFSMLARTHLLLSRCDVLKLRLRLVQRRRRSRAGRRRSRWRRRIGRGPDSQVALDLDVRIEIKVDVGAASVRLFALGIAFKIGATNRLTSVELLGRWRKVVPRAGFRG